MILDVVVLAGGRGRRLGGLSKADLVVGGARLLDHILGDLADWDHPAVTLGRTVVVAPDTVNVPDGVRRTLEEPPGGGPSAGVAAASCWRPKRVRKCTSLSLVWSMCCTGLAARLSSILACNLFLAAMSRTIWPSVVSCQLWLARWRKVLRSSALRQRMSTVSGVPRCSISSTVKLPLSTMPVC